MAVIFGGSSGEVGRRGGVFVATMATGNRPGSDPILEIFRLDTDPRPPRKNPQHGENAEASGQKDSSEFLQT